MKKVVNYLVCSTAIMVAVVLLCSGNLWSLVGMLWCGMLYVSGEAFPRFWKTYWMTNIRILSYFNCL